VNDYGELGSEVSLDPAALGYAGKTAEQVLALLNTPGNLLSSPRTGAGWTKPRPLVPVSNLLQWAATPDGGTPGPFAAIQAGANNASDPLQAICIAALKLFGSVDILDLSDPTNVALVAALESAGKVTANQEASLLALALIPCSRAEEVFGPGALVSRDDLRHVGF